MSTYLSLTPYLRDYHGKPKEAEALILADFMRGRDFFLASHEGTARPLPINRSQIEEVYPDAVCNVRYQELRQVCVLKRNQERTGWEVYRG